MNATSFLLVALSALTGQTGPSEGGTVPQGTVGPEASSALAPRPAVHGRTRTFVLVGSRPYYELGSEALVERREVPIVQDFFLDAETGVDGLSIALDAWIGLDVGQQVLSRRALADVIEGYIQWKQPSFTLKAGRLYVQSSIARRERMDGGWVRVHPKAELLGGKLTFDVYGGLPVTPELGEEVLRASGSPTLANDPLVLAAAGSDWSRPGDWVVGTMVAMRWGPTADVGIGFVRQNDLSIVDREALVARFDLEPTSFLGISGYGSYDTYGGAVEDARVTVSSWIGRDLRLGVFARMSNPSLLLPSSSIFSVFANQSHREVGLEADLWLARQHRLSGSAEWRQSAVDDELDEAADGHRIAVSLRGPVPGLPQMRGIVSVERMADGWAGDYEYARIGAETPIISWLSMSADGGLFFIEGSESLGTTDRTALRGSLAAIAERYKDWRIALALRATKTPDVSTDIAVIARIEWNAERTF
ncbi:hypothetical protein L6R52_28245 [Myxococcota bacterium]|nr:hypothetical protein [Myxococcota bacterium]